LPLDDIFQVQVRIERFRPWVASVLSLCLPKLPVVGWGKGNTPPIHHLDASDQCHDQTTPALSTRGGGALVSQACQPEPPPRENSSAYPISIIIM